MLTRLVLRNFKIFDEVEIELGERVVLAGPSNSGKSTVLQALSLWSTCVQHWVKKYGFQGVPKHRRPVVLSTQDLTVQPVPTADFLWHKPHTDVGKTKDGSAADVPIEIEVSGVHEDAQWCMPVELHYTNEASFRCHPKIGCGDSYQEVPRAALLRVVYLPPMLGVAPTEPRLYDGAISVRLGEGRTSEVLRNICWQAATTDRHKWDNVVKMMNAMFGIQLNTPEYIAKRGEIEMTYRHGGMDFDLQTSSLGQQQVLLMLSYMVANPGVVLLLEEPGAHLDALLQRQVYDALMTVADETGSQVIATSHSDTIIDEAASRDMVVALVDKPRRIDVRALPQGAEAIMAIGFDQYLQALQTGWVLYLNGATDLAILRVLAEKLEHPARAVLDRPFVYYIGDQPARALDHFRTLRKAKQDLVGIAIYSRLESGVVDCPNLTQLAWSKREIESYLCQHNSLLAYARSFAKGSHDLMFAPQAMGAMTAAIDKVLSSRWILGDDGKFGPDVRVSDDFISPVLRTFLEEMGWPAATLGRTGYHVLARFVSKEAIDPEIVRKLDAIRAVAETAVGWRCGR